MGPSGPQGYPGKPVCIQGFHMKPCSHVCNDNCMQSFRLISGYNRERWKGWITRETWSKGLFRQQDVIKFNQDKKNEDMRLAKQKLLQQNLLFPKVVLLMSGNHENVVIQY